MLNENYARGLLETCGAVPGPGVPAALSAAATSCDAAPAAAASACSPCV